jgi:hypothetical protein
MEWLDGEERRNEDAADRLAERWGARPMRNADHANDHTRREARALTDRFGR